MLSCIIMISLQFSPIAWAHLEGEHLLGSIGGVSEAYLNSPLPVLNGIGRDETTKLTSSLADDDLKNKARIYTHQGLALNHAFQWEDAVRSFYEALRLDSKMSRAYVGLSLSFTMLNRDSSKLNTVLKNLIAQAQWAASSVQNNEVDRLWVDVTQLFFEAKYGIPSAVLVSQKAQSLKNQTGSQKLETLLEVLVQMSDPEAFAFWGWEIGRAEKLEEGLRQFPNHMGILHYLVHIYENSGRYQQAIHLAERMVALAPEAPHIVHMFGHVLPMVGRWQEANAHFLKAHCLHLAVLRQSDAVCANISVDAALSDIQPQPQEFWHYAHNLQLFGFSLMRTRDLGQAENILKTLCEVGNCQPLYEFYLGEKKPEKVLEALEQKKLRLNEAYFVVQALILQGNVALAEQQLAALPEDPSLGRFVTDLFVSFARGSLSEIQKQQLNRFLQNATTNPNFDTWSNLLPVLRKLHHVAMQYQAPENTDIFDAIQKIDPGHPLSAF